MHKILKLQQKWQFTAIEFANLLGIGLGFLIMVLPQVKKGLNALGNKYPKIGRGVQFLPVVLGYVASIIASFPIMAWAAKTQVGASRKGRLKLCEQT